MSYRLIKSEPNKYSRDGLVHDGSTTRDGVRNYQARNNLKAMKTWDLCFFYHSNIGKEIVGIAQVTQEYFPDPTSEDERRVAVTIIPVNPLNPPVTLEQIKADPKLADIQLLRQQRLSVASLQEWEYNYILWLHKK